MLPRQGTGPALLSVISGKGEGGSSFSRWRQLDPGERASVILNKGFLKEKSAYSLSMLPLIEYLDTIFGFL